VGGTTKVGEDTAHPSAADTPGSHPGHGDDTTIGAERTSLPERRERGW
jgi:hypothetical protein